MYRYAFGISTIITITPTTATPIYYCVYIMNSSNMGINFMANTKKKKKRADSIVI